MPAAGRARRLGEPTASKEAEPVYVPRRGPAVPRPVCYRLLDAFEEAGIERALAVTRPEKADLALALSSRSSPPSVQVIQIEDSPSAAFTVSIASRAAGDAVIALGFPDVLWSGEDAFGRLLNRLSAGPEVVLGLFPPSPDYPTDGVVVGAGGRVEAIERPGAFEHGGLPAWTIAAWRPGFSRILERVVGSVAARERASELGMSDVIRVAIESGVRVDAVEVSAAPFLDVGHPDRLARARREAAGEDDAPVGD